MRLAFPAAAILLPAAFFLSVLDPAATPAHAVLHEAEGACPPCEIGGAALLLRMDRAMRPFVAANLRIVEHFEPDTLQDVFGTVVGRALPENAHIVRPA